MFNSGSLLMLLVGVLIGMLLSSSLPHEPDHQTSDFYTSGQTDDFYIDPEHQAEFERQFYRKDHDAEQENGDDRR